MDEIFVFLAIGYCAFQTFLSRRYMNEILKLESEIISGTDKLTNSVSGFNHEFKEMKKELFFLRTEVHILKEKNNTLTPKINGEKFID